MEDPHAKQVSPVSIISDVRRDSDFLELAKSGMVSSAKRESSLPTSSVRV